MAFLTSGYHDRDAEESHGFINKLEGLAKVAGIIGVGVLARKPLARFAGDVSESLAARLARRSSQVTEAGLTNFQEQVGSTMRSAARVLLSRQQNLFTEGLERMRSQIASAPIHAGRIGEELLGNVRNHVTPDTLRAFDDRQVRDRMLAQLRKVAEARDVNEARDHLLTSEGLQRFQEAAKGVKFTFADEAAMRDQLRTYLDRAMKARPTRGVIKDFLAEGKNAQANRQNIIQAMQEALEAENKRDAAVGKFIAHDRDGFREITMGELMHDTQVRRAANRYFETLGVKADPSQFANPIDEHIFRFRKAKLELFGGDGDVIPPEVDTFLEDAFTNAKSGLAMTRDGQVLSLAALRNQREDFVFKALEEVQIPLLPFAFNVPAKVFSFMRPNTELVKGLGNLRSAGELRRMGLLDGLSEFSEGMGIGDAVLAVDPESMAIQRLGGPGSKFVSFNRRDAAKIDRQAIARGIETETYLEAPGSFRDLVRRLRQGDETEFTKLESLLYSGQEKYLDLSYANQGERGLGFVVTPKDPILAPLVRRIYKGGGVGAPISKLNPKQLWRFLQGAAGESIDPNHLSEALNHVIREGAGARADLSPLLKRLAQDMGPGGGLDARGIPDELWDPVVRMALNSDDPRRMLQIADESGVLSDFSLLNEKATSDFFQAMTAIERDRSSLFKVGRNEGGFRGSIKAAMFGEDTVSEAVQNLQKGLLSEIVRGVGIRDVENSLGIGQGGLAEEIKALASSVAAGQDPFRSPLGRFFAGKGLSQRHQVVNLLSQIMYVDKGVDQVSLRGLGSIGALGLDIEQLTGRSGSNTLNAKMLEILRKDLGAFNNAMGYPDLVNARLMDLATKGGLGDALQSRFSSGRLFHPRPDYMDPSAGSHWYVVPNSAPSMADFAMDPLGSVKSLVRRGGGLGPFAQSLVDPDQPMGQYGMLANILAAAPNQLGNVFGAGLPVADRVTPLRAVGGFLLKRVLPVYVGYEAYKNLNSNLHAMGLPGLDDMAANLVANANLVGASVKDATGITSLSQGLVGALPGLDLWFHPRSREESEEYLFYGDEEVRENRLWFIGSRDPVHGTRTKYFRPNYYRRWKSHWTEASNVRISDPMYSFLPNLQNPLAPIFRLLSPDWWEQRVAKDRPYPETWEGAMESDRDLLGLGPGDTRYLASNYGLGGGEGGEGGGGVGGGGALGRFGQGLPMMMNLPGYATGGGGGGQGGFGEGGGKGDPIYIRSTYIPTVGMLQTGVYDKVAATFEAIRTHTGLYGATMQMIPFWPKERVGVEAQDPDSAHSFNRMMWMGEYGETTGPIGEFFRRFIYPDMQAYDAYNPLPNSMPSWLPEKLQYGDPYMRVPGIGELQLPGDAYERTHPWVMPLKVRASAIGGTEEEIIQGWLNPFEEMTQRGEDMVEFGHRAHLLIQRQLAEMGQLVGNEVSVYDREHNISGTLDAVVRGAQGYEVIDVKTQGGEMFRQGLVPEKYIDQITFYMHSLGLEKGHLAFVNRDNPDEVRIESFDFDPKRWAGIVQRVESARSRMQQMVDDGLISPYEAYDPVSRLDILAKAAPMSREYRETLEQVELMPLNENERMRLDTAKQQAVKLTQQYNLYPRRYGLDTETQDLEVEGVTDDGQIVTELGVVRLAGVKFKHGAFALQDAQDVLAGYGIRVGDTAPVTMLEGQFNPEVMNDVTMAAQIGGVNRRLIDDGYAEADTSDRGPMASRVIHGNSMFGQLWEWMVHSDNMLTNKFMRVRTPLEQFERGEVYGTDKARWSDIYGTMVEPTVTSLIAKDPLSASLQSGIVASLFFRSRAARWKAAKVGAILGGGLSLIRGLGEILNGEPWKPRRYRRQSEFDEYWDTLEYLKWTSIAEEAKRNADSEEGVDIDSLNASEKREERQLGPWAVLAIDAERKAKRTMYGYDAEQGSLQDAIAALPRRQQQLAQEVILSGSVEEKRRFYELLPEAQQRVLGRFLGIEGLPDKPNLTEYFENHYLPDMEWAGWDRDVDIEDLRVRAADLEGMRVEKPSRTRLNKARAYTQDVDIPRSDYPTAGNIRRALEELMQDHPGLEADFVTTPAERNQIDVNLDLYEDQTSELADQMRRDIRRR